MAALSTKAPRMSLANESKSLSPSKSVPLFSTDQLDQHKQQHYSSSIHSADPLSRTQSMRPAQYHPNFAPIHSSRKQQHHRQQRPRRTLDQFPTNVLINVGSQLDVRSRLLFSRTCKRNHAMMMQRDVWHTVVFSNDDVEFINDMVMQKLIHLLLRFQLHYALRHVVVDHTQLSAISIGQLLQFFPAIRLLSLRHCLSMDYHQLASILDGLSASAASGNNNSISISSSSSSISSSNSRRGAVCRPDLKSFRMISKAPNTPMHGTDIKAIHLALERLAQHSVMMDCYVCDQCGVNACPATLACLHCGILVMKRCKACAPVCDQCHGRVCGGTSCQVKSDIQLVLSDCGRCEQPLPLCNRHGDGSGDHQRCTSIENHGLFHARCRIKNKWVSNRCTSCGIVACPFCDLSKCGGGCRGQWCQQCVTNVDLHYCKCILIHGVVGSKMSKRTVCGQCRQICPRCTGQSSDSTNTSFCHRCLDLHQQECTQATKSKGKKSNRKTGK
ncbi:unnamed protein product [Absidia cylindrospora]